MSIGYWFEALLLYLSHSSWRPGDKKWRNLLVSFRRTISRGTQGKINRFPYTWEFYNDLYEYWKKKDPTGFGSFELGNNGSGYGPDNPDDIEDNEENEGQDQDQEQEYEAEETEDGDGDGDMNKFLTVTLSDSEGEQDQEQDDR